jgi:hypothetical protein
MDEKAECANWTAVKAGDDLLVYGVCTFRSGTWTVKLEHDNLWTVMDPKTLRLRTKADCGGSTTVMSYLLPSVTTKGGSEVQNVSVDGTRAELKDLTPGS